ncbi:MAG: biotin--[acetyl-CoA-carboxylase] ligase [Phycisphaerales bacterium]|nr:biotin--[acetyl-CoA-carboxylase] ligase [Phycisphaerales bacterium]
MSGPPSARIDALADWPAALEVTIAHCASWRSVHVLRETASTQDHARGLEVGAVVIAARQTAGRGRLGRAWIDTGDDGLAMSLNVASRAGSGQHAERLALAVAIAAAESIEEVCRADSGGAPAVALKWPNDLLIARLKVGGILIEQTESIATIGIGINCSQQAFPAELAGRATSLRLQGFAIDRLDLARTLLARLDAWLVATGEAITGAYAARDCLVGSRAVFRTPSGMVDGIVLRVDPAEGLIVRTSRGDQRLPGGTTSVFVPEDRL